LTKQTQQAIKNVKFGALSFRLPLKLFAQFYEQAS